ncbi:hypothetical protein AB0F13_27410 [Streptomyces sp. NPDC026206]|uniref:hypothetical protein n=1 Tax=Streptomyces sp. NPDC026206 TaxID=3157089 RepID=UPI0033D1AD9A
MPLPFLTADRDGDNLAAPAATTSTPTTANATVTTAGATPTAASPAHGEPEDAYESRHRWRRPYHPGALRVGGAAVVLLLAGYVLLCALVIALAGALLGAGVCLAVGALLITLAVRLVRTGIWVSPQGLRQSRLLSGTTLPWSDVAAVRTVQQPVRLLGLPRTVQGQVLVVERTQGGPLPAVLTDHGADFLGRPQAFAMAADAVEDWVAELRG